MKNLVAECDKSWVLYTVKYDHNEANIEMLVKNVPLSDLGAECVGPALLARQQPDSKPTARFRFDSLSG